MGIIQSFGYVSFLPVKIFWAFHPFYPAPHWLKHCSLQRCGFPSKHVLVCEWQSTNYKSAVGECHGRPYQG